MFNNFNFFDLKSSMQDSIKAQEKFLKSFESMMDVKGNLSNQTPREVVFEEDKLKLYHYKKSTRTVSKVPTLIVYALVNTPAMMDIGDDKSFIKKLVDSGLDLYLIEWGFPTQEDKYLTLDDYINIYIDDCVDHIRKESGADKINILGVCQGGTFSLMYTALHQEKIKNVVTMVTPVDFSTDDGLLFKWGKYLNSDRMVEAYGVVPGEFMNTGFLTLKPISLMVNKYVDLINDLDEPDNLSNFMTMEKWIFDSPGQAGMAYKDFLNSMYRENKLAKGEMEIGGKKVDLKKITQPVLNLYAERDNQVPNAASIPLKDLVGSKDYTAKGFPTGHIGMFVSGRSQKEVAPTVVDWVKAHSK
ncbi:class III poly(R)-hydroxyalkanoic acid synthase subunit PhaC [uncultured Anaerococcus sp.]|uniref:class III poly(R)-hydroxyalkanoic acid synthase subunit PhaC n=1 Tax=uncultured Anaerococcus sp. TaxID=293428 RepID=UPI0025DF0E1D|nr:class III poly(R)-hydroxyalkanoic acid synthase subunit PhaC [uncultured Anaerococcus sp.]